MQRQRMGRAGWGQDATPRRQKGYPREEERLSREGKGAAGGVGLKCSSLVCLNTQSPDGGDIWRGCGTLKMWALAVRGGLLGMGVWGLESELVPV